MDSKATIVWQDGTEEKDIPTTQLYYSMSLDDHEFFPGEWVVIDGDKEEPGQRYGAVQQVNCLERTATVKWFKCDEKETKPETVEVNEMSVYDLKKHSKYEFRPGIVVKRKPTEENKLGYVLDSCPEVRKMTNVSFIRCSSFVQFKYFMGWGASGFSYGTNFIILC